MRYSTSFEKLCNLAWLAAPAQLLEVLKGHDHGEMAMMAPAMASATSMAITMRPHVFMGRHIFSFLFFILFLSHRLIGG